MIRDKEQAWSLSRKGQIFDGRSAVVKVGALTTAMGNE
jgi:hypothetical protein